MRCSKVFWTLQNAQNAYPVLQMKVLANVVGHILVYCVISLFSFFWTNLSMVANEEIR